MVRLIKSKRIQLFAVLILAASIVATGTYAWNGFIGHTDIDTPSVIPDNVTLVDFSTQWGEIYAVNHSNDAMLIRVRMDEYMEIDGKPASPRDYVNLIYGKSVMSFSEWRSADAPIGDIWVEDIDGWFYYAKALQPGDATRMLLQEIKQTGFNILVKGSHRIVTSLQAVPKGSVDELAVLDKSNITNGGLLLMRYLSGDFVKFAP